MSISKQGSPPKTSTQSAENPGYPSQDTRQSRQLVGFRHEGPQHNSAAPLSDPAYMATHTHVSSMPRKKNHETCKPLKRKSSQPGSGNRLPRCGLTRPLHLDQG